MLVQHWKQYKRKARGIEKIGRACGTHGGGQVCAQGVGGEAWGKEAIGETKT